MTEEQAAIVEAYAGGSALRVVAYAGAGKTTTLQRMAQSQPGRRGLYLAFNRAIADEAARKFQGTSTDARTAHSLAYRAVKGMGFSDDKLRGKITGRSLAAKFVPRVAGVSDAVVRQLLARTLAQFLQSADPVPAAYHLPRMLKARGGRIVKIEPEFEPAFAQTPGWGSGQPRRVSRRTWSTDLDVDEEIMAEVPQAACELWRAQCDPRDPTPLGHDGYLKLFGMSRPALPYDVLMVDEAQDLNPVLIDMVRRQGCQVVAVGDPHQQIYAWRGAVNALAQLGGRELRLSQSFRFGDRIAELATRVVEQLGETVPVRGCDRPSSVRRPGGAEACAVLCRTNVGVVRALAQQLERGYSVHVPGGVTELRMLLEDVQRLQGGQPASSAELFGFDSWSEVLRYVEEDEGSDLLSLVQLVEDSQVSELIRLLDAVRSHPEGADRVVSTAHKAKGLQWRSVELRGFRCDGEPAPDERRLFYVAATRAQDSVAVDPEVLKAFTT